MYDFKHFLLNSLPFSEVIKTVTFHSPYLVIIQTKRKSEIFGYKDVTERGIRKIVKQSKNNTDALVSFPWMTKQIQI